MKLPGAPLFDSYSPFWGACSHGVALPPCVHPETLLLLASLSTFWPARQPTAAITAPAGALAVAVGLTITSVTSLAKKHRRLVVSPAQLGE